MSNTPLATPGPPGTARCVLLSPLSPEALLLVYLRHLPGKNRRRTFGTKRRRLEAELGQEQLCPPAGRFRRGNFPPGGGNHRHHHHQPLSHLGGVIFINLFNSTISSQTLVHLLYPIFVSKPQIGTYGLLVVLITPCS